MDNRKMAETLVYRRKRAKYSSNISEAGKITVVSTDKTDENIIVYGRRNRRKKQLDGLDEDAKRTLSTDKGQNERIKLLSTNRGHEEIIVYNKRNLTRMHLKDLSKAGGKATIATYERHEALINEGHQKAIDYESGMLRETQLNDLPEEILGSIVSRLPLRDAVRTSILSTKLKRIWTCHPNLTFTKQALFPDKTFEGTKQMRLALIQGIHAVLGQHRGNGVERIVLKGFLLGQCARVTLSACVRFAATSGAKSLSLTLCPENPFCFPTCLFDTRRGSKSVLKDLCLKFVSLRIPLDFTGFLHLKRLELDCTFDIQDGELQQLLKNCLLLEDLILNMIYIHKELVISQALNRLRCLSLSVFGQVKRIEIVAANLERFEYKGCTETSVVFPQTLQKVKYVSIQSELFNSHAGEFMLSALPRSVPGLETLVWKTEGIEMDGLPNCIGRFQCLKTVQIELCATPNPFACDVLSFTALLDASPVLESFSLQLIGFINCPYPGIEFRKLPSSPHHHLKSV